MSVKTVEYIQLKVPLGDLGALNRLGAAGFQLAAAIPEMDSDGIPIAFYAILMRELPD